MIAALKNSRKYVVLSSVAVLFFLLIAGCGGRKNTVPVAEDIQPVGNEQISDQMDGGNGTRQVIYYQRTHCFGTCPVFRFTALADGSCTYEGINFVDRIGTHTGRVEPGKVKAISALASSMNYFSLDTLYDDQYLMDLPAVITIIDGKTVINRYQGPDLNALYTSLDALIEDVQWETSRDR
jgi:hypothetical protein